MNDIILYYAREEDATWNAQYSPYDSEYVAKNYRHDDDDGRGPYTLDNMAAPEGGGMAAILPETGRPRGWYVWKGYHPPERGWRYSQETMQKLDEEERVWYPASKNNRLRLKRYLNEMPGRIVDTNWADVSPIGAHANERLGYPTQKPLALLERIIRASSNPGDVVLDPFCGCGTAIDAAQSLGRRWLGIDVTHLSVALMKYRLQDRHGLRAGSDYRVIGEPQDLAGARNLAQQEHDGRYQFQWWALSLIGARPLGSQGSGRKGRKGADGGVDGLIHFLDEDKRTQRVVVQVKSGKVGRPDIGDLRGLLQGGAAIGVFITLEPPTGPMQQEAFGAGYYESELWGRFPRLQILTIEQLLDGASVDMPAQHGTFRQAPRAREERDEQKPLL